MYVVIQGLLRVLIGAKGAGKWGMHKLNRKNKRATAAATALSPTANTTARTSHSPDPSHSPHTHSPSLESAMGLESPIPGRGGNGETTRGCAYV